MFFAPTQCFPVIMEDFNLKLIALHTRNPDRVFAIVRREGDFKTYRSVGRPIRDRIGFNEVPTQHGDEFA